jgi:hypothetical protein
MIRKEFKTNQQHNSIKVAENAGIVVYTTSIKLDNIIDDQGRESYAEDDKYKIFDNPFHFFC